MRVATSKWTLARTLPQKYGDLLPRVGARSRMQFEAKSREQLIAETMAELDEAFKEYSAPQPERALPPSVAVPELGAAGCVSCTHTRAILQQAGWGSLLTRTQVKTHDAAG